METLEIEEILGRMYNWEMENAYKQALKAKNFPPEALEMLKVVSKNYGNCGWMPSASFLPIVHVNNTVASLLGYKWSDEKDFWIPNN